MQKRANSSDFDTETNGGGRGKKIRMELKTFEKKAGGGSRGSTAAVDLDDIEVEKNAASKDLVIPLIVKNIYRNTAAAKSETNGTKGNAPIAAAGEKIRSTAPSAVPIAYGLTVPVSKKAVKEESEEMNIDFKEEVAAPELSVEEQAIQSLLNGELPILAQNTIPGLDNLSSEKEKFMHDISHRPDEMSAEDYERVPIESFGVALLKGMGWKEGTAVGKNPNGLVAPIVLTPRASLLGLGATPAPQQLDPTQKDKRPKKVLPGDKIVIGKQKSSKEHEEYLPRSSSNAAATESSNNIKLSSRVLITGGSQKGAKGVVTDVYSKSDGIVIKVKLDSSGEIKGVWDDQVKLLSESSQSPSSSSLKSSWLRPFIRVRIISKSFRDGEYYNHKCVVQDVTTRGQCIVKTEKGVLLDQVLEKYLETVIPTVGKSVMILQHKTDSSLIGQVATLLSCNDEKETATVRVDSTFDMEVFTFVSLGIKNCVTNSLPRLSFVECHI